MGLAVAVLEELRLRGCMLVATTHYPEVKAYCQQAGGLLNARMCFDEETLAPTYVLEVGLPGRSCALAIARRIGLPENLLERARQYSEEKRFIEPTAQDPPPSTLIRHITSAKEPPRITRAQSFALGDCVLIYPNREIGIVCKTADDKGMVTVQVKTEKRPVNHKRLKRIAPAEEMDPENYDFAIVFDSVKNRKARNVLNKRHDPGAVIHIQ